MADEAYPIPGTSQITDLVLWESFFSAVQLDGVFYGLDPSLNAGARTVVLAPGAAYIRGFYKPVTSSTATAVPAAASQNRVDRLVMRLNRGASGTPGDFVKPVVLTGTPGTTTPPALTWQITPTGIYDLPICRWTSQSNGGLSGLVLERYYLGGGFETAARTGGVLPAFPPRLGLEKETGTVFRSDGTAWTQILDDTGWVSLTPNGPNANAWSNNNVSRIRRVNGRCHLRFSIQRWSTNGVGTDDADGSAPFSLDSQFRPTADEWGFAMHGRSPVGVKVEAAGNVRLYPLINDIPANRTVQGSVSWLVG